MPKLVRNDMGGDTGAGCSLCKRLAKVLAKGDAAGAVRQEKAIIRGRRQSGEEAQACNQFAHFTIDGSPAVIVKFADGHVQSPVIAAQMAEAVGREIDGFTDAHAG